MTSKKKVVEQVEPIQMRFRTPYDQIKKHPGIGFAKVGKTKPEFADSCDINKIVARHGIGAVAQPLEHSEAMYGDFSEVGSYQEALNKVIEVQDQFLGMPAKLRDRFKNDPEKMLDFINDEANLQEAVELGMLPKEALPQVEASASEASENAPVQSGESDA